MISLFVSGTGAGKSPAWHRLGKPKLPVVRIPKKTARLFQLAAGQRRIHIKPNFNRYTRRFAVI